MNADDFARMLPSKVKEALTAHFLRRMKEEGCNSYNQPKFKLTNAYQEIGVDKGWLSNLVPDCMTAAEKEYDRLHPLQWNNETQKAYRDGLK